LFFEYSITPEDVVGFTNANRNNRRRRFFLRSIYYGLFLLSIRARVKCSPRTAVVFIDMYRRPRCTFSVPNGTEWLKKQWPSIYLPRYAHRLSTHRTRTGRVTGTANASRVQSSGRVGSDWFVSDRPPRVGHVRVGVSTKKSDGRDFGRACRRDSRPEKSFL